ncbi:hypothetical protein [Pseudorhodobacter wandonensis]|uniref:hypothetical protein n=1 Tax=Pseudorhodobacter wandonensis TaxID=1120568 RepID=UPI00067AAF68|nr:hypothetical protein [Pseudorhodobacter wandonensis]
MIPSYTLPEAASMGEKPVAVLDRRLSILMGFVHVLEAIKLGVIHRLLTFFQGGQTADKMKTTRNPERSRMC